MAHESSVERRLAAIVATDVVGFSRLVEADEEGTLGRFGELRREVVEPAIARHRGRIVKTIGDGLLIEFASVVEAVRFAIEIQESLAQRGSEESPERRIRMRVGVNLGDIVVEGGDIFGDGVNVAARLEALCDPGGICLSQAAREHLEGKLQLSLEDMGERQLKNITRSVRVYRVRGLGSSGALASAASVSRNRRTTILASTFAVVLMAVGGWWIWSQFAGTQHRQADTAASSEQPSANDRLRLKGRTPIAVMPFANLSGDERQKYFSDGLTEEITGALGRFSSLSVVARNAVTQRQQKGDTPATIAHELGVRYLVEGTVRRTDKQVRVSVSLSDPSASRIIWTQQFTSDLGDVFAMQDEVTRRIVSALAVRVTRAEQERVSRKPTDSQEAYDLVLRARALLNSEGRAANVEARQILLRAIEIDPTYPDAYVELGQSYRIQVNQGWTTGPNEALARAESAVRKAIELDDRNSRAFGLLGRIMIMRQQFDAAKSAAQRAIELNPSDNEGYWSLGTVLLYSGDVSAAIDALETAQAYNPARDEYSTLTLTLAYYVAGRNRECIDFVEGVVGRDAAHAFTYFVLAMAYAEIGNVREAQAVAAIARRKNPLFDPSAFGSLLRDPSQQAKVREGLRKAGFE